MGILASFLLQRQPGCGISKPGALPLQPMLLTEQHGCRWHHASSGLQDRTCQRLVVVHVHNVYKTALS